MLIIPAWIMYAVGVIAHMWLILVFLGFYAVRNSYIKPKLTVYDTLPWMIGLPLFYCWLFFA